MSKKNQYHNGRVIGELLKKIGPENAAVRNDSEWELQIYYSDRDEDSMTIEMCLHTTVQGDSLYDPSLRIELNLDAKGHIKTAKALSYWSRTPFCDMELILEDEDLDERLDNWLNSLKQQGYFSGEVTKNLRKYRADQYFSDNNSAYGSDHKAGPFLYSVLF